VERFAAKEEANVLICSNQKQTCVEE